jgi:hypothetical protein
VRPAASLSGAAPAVCQCATRLQGLGSTTCHGRAAVAKRPVAATTYYRTQTVTTTQAGRCRADTAIAVRRTRGWLPGSVVFGHSRMDAERVCDSHAESAASVRDQPRPCRNEIPRRSGLRGGRWSEAQLAIKKTKDTSRRGWTDPPHRIETREGPR